MLNEKNNGDIPSKVFMLQLKNLLHGEIEGARKKTFKGEGIGQFSS